MPSQRRFFIRPGRRAPSSVHRYRFIHSFIHPSIIHPSIHPSIVPLQRVRIVRILSRHAERVVHRSSRVFRHPVTPRSRPRALRAAARSRRDVSMIPRGGHPGGWVPTSSGRRASGRTRRAHRVDERERERIRDDSCAVQCRFVCVCVLYSAVGESRSLRGGVAENAADELDL